MRAHLVQLDIHWEDPEKNFESVRSLLSSTKTTPGDLIALPELFDSGFTLNTEKCADDAGTTLAFLQQLANETGCLIQGSRSIQPALDAPDRRAYNCATITAPDADAPVAEYIKIHPFSMGNELRAYQGGNTINAYTWESGSESLNACPAICYDLRFPELFRAGAVQGAQLFVLGANWPDARQHHWRSLLIARAIENQAFVLGINRSGDDPHLHYAGGTIAVGPKGEILGELDDQQAVLSVEIDPTQVTQWRTKFPLLEDIKIHSF
ncbi:MAG: nitrilase-related carbon-nitrogen hydrolase [Phycisphaerales bacterium]